MGEDATGGGAPVLLVVGGDPAGMSAASVVRSRRPDAGVRVVERGSATSYAMCGIPMLLGGEVGSAEDLVARSPEAHRERGVDVATGVEAVAVDPAARRVRVRAVDDGEQWDEPYDALVLATGARPVLEPIEGLAEHAHTVHGLEEGRRLRAELDARGDGVERAVVVGAGYIGVEVAEAMLRRGVPTTVVDMAERVMGTLEPEVSQRLRDALTGFGVDLRLGSPVRGVAPRDGRLVVRTDVEEVVGDIVVAATGTRPLVDLHRDAGCGLGASGAVRVDGRMRTTVEGVWAAGDCVESPHVVGGPPVNVQLGTHANKQGRIAGLDVAARLPQRAGEPLADGAGAAVFPGVAGTAVTRLCDVEVARTGLTAAEAEAAGIDFADAVVEGPARAGYMPDPGEVLVKMLAEQGTGRVLGCQMVGTGNVARRIDVAAIWAQTGTSVADAQLQDLAYAPPFGAVWDLPQVAARKLVGRLGIEPRL